MAIRPIFVVTSDKRYCIRENVEFEFFSGFSDTQKRKSISSLHQEYLKKNKTKKILEIFDFFSRSSVFDVKSNVLFLCNSIFFIEIGCNAAFQRTATSKFDLDGILATPIYIRRTACTVL